MSSSSDVTPFGQDPTILPAIIEMAGSVIIALTPDHRIVEWNREAERLYQTPRAQALGLDYVGTFIAPEHRAFVAADIVEVLAGKRTMHFEDDSILPDGSRRTLIWNVTRMLGPDSTPTGIVAMGQDITERKEAEERFRLVFEHATDGLLLSENGRVLDCNPEALRILGLSSRDELIGRRPAEFSPPVQPDGEDSDAKSRALGAQTAAIGELRFEWVHRRPSGDDVPVEVHVRHAMLRGRRISVVSWYDLSERRALEARQRDLQERLAHASKMDAVGQLAGGIAHDFNNLLTAIRNAIDLARAGLDPASDPASDLALAAEATDRAAALTKQLLALSRRESAAAGTVDLSLLVRDTLRLLKATVPPGVALVDEIAPPSCLVDGDRSEYEQVLMNLVLNARDAMPAGGTLRVTLAADHDTATLTVRDTGKGIPAHVLPRVFEPFFSTKPAGQGTGLGLAVVYGVVSKRGGVVTAESPPGAGACFTVRVPRSARQPAAPPSATATVPGEARRGTVLLVDDDPVVRSTTRRLLERAGWQVQEASDGAAGHALFVGSPEAFSVVLSDVRMPGLSGPALVRKIRETHPATRVVLFSGYDRLDGADDQLPSDVPLLYKPFRPEELVATVAAACA
ncbi:MAG: PAS domain S-box protein [Gemmatimonadaceae bacterium]|nr:PAS domain S-box protein [Gemmatimonadaceae bacterium]